MPAILNIPNLMFDIPRIASDAGSSDFEYQLGSGQLVLRDVDQASADSALVAYDDLEVRQKPHLVRIVAVVAQERLDVGFVHEGHTYKTNRLMQMLISATMTKLEMDNQGNLNDNNDIGFPEALKVAATEAGQTGMGGGIYDTSLDIQVFTKTQFVAFALALLDFCTAVTRNERLLKTTIQSAVSQSVFDAIDIQAGWPN